MEMILKTTNLCKSFSGQTVVNNISLNIERNSVYGLLGPNGAGKSTTLKMITGILKPTSGNIEFDDHTWKRSDTVFDFKKTEESINDRFEVNPENATQLLWGRTVYQVTSDMVSDDELGSYIDILAESVTFDTETKIPLSKEDLSKIDWYGENAGQGREYWFYTDVYEIYGTDKAEAVAVNVNDNYYIAKRQ